MFINVIVDLDIDSYLYQNARSEAFSRWLSYSANYYVQQETTKKAQKVCLYFYNSNTDFAGRT